VVVDLPRDIEGEDDRYYETELANGSVLDYVLREDVKRQGVVPWEVNGDNRTLHCQPARFCAAKEIQTYTVELERVMTSFRFCYWPVYLFSTRLRKTWLFGQFTTTPPLLHSFCYSHISSF
jgi:hypothetical protein